MTENDGLGMGLMADIQHYCIQDGPGTRTTVFLKGCPLRCQWCHNPEMINPVREAWHNPRTCTLCGRCAQACPEGAITGLPEGWALNRALCIADSGCNKCAEACPTGALDIVGKPISVEKAVDEVLRDSFLYQRGGGGACISGGEPMLQAKFTIDFLKACQDQLIDTAIETCCYADWDGLEQAAPYVDLFLVDIKHMDSAMHKTGTGVDNRRILENIERLAQLGKKIRIRLPIIPEYNDSEENLRATANFMLKNDITHIDLLGFHATGGFKYDKLGKDYAHANTAEPTPAEMEAHMALFRDFGIEGTIGGTDIDAF